MARHGLACHDLFHALRAERSAHHRNRRRLVGERRTTETPPDFPPRFASCDPISALNPARFSRLVD
jgi:hypothetical protein